MGKGSKRRKGADDKAYADNYDSIFGTRKDEDKKLDGDKRKHDA